MYLPFFVAAAQSPSRQIAWRVVVAAHLFVVGCCFWWFREWQTHQPAPLPAIFLLLMGIFEGAILIGWKLSQMPKSRALEFLLASPLSSPRIFLSEAGVGLGQLALTTMTGLPFLLLLVLDGNLEYGDVIPLLLWPFSCGAVTGLALTLWAYEPAAWRRVVEKIFLGLLFLYLLVGVLAGEKLNQWLRFLPHNVDTMIVETVRLTHSQNPFAVMKHSIERPAHEMLPWYLSVQGITLLLIAVLLMRAAWRFHGHFHEKHYSPVLDASGRKRTTIGVRPLSWWAVKRVSEYSGRINLWLAAGFGVLYALHIMAGDNWPVWMGRKVFVMFDQLFGIAGVTTALVVLAAVPAAFQYGLWDSNTQDRCRRLELLLLTRLEALDYWAAAMAASWRRGCGYFIIAILLWTAAVFGGNMTVLQALYAAFAALLMWLLYFTLGFRAFSTGMQANRLGLFLTVVIPIATILVVNARIPIIPALSPPGMVYFAASSRNAVAPLPGILLTTMLTLWLQRISLARCMDELKHWYEKYHGRKVVD